MSAQRPLNMRVPDEIARAFDLPPDLDDISRAHLRVLMQTAAQLAMSGHADTAIAAVSHAIGHAATLQRRHDA